MTWSQISGYPQPSMPDDPLDIELDGCDESDWLDGESLDESDPLDSDPLDDPSLDLVDDGDDVSDSSDVSEMSDGGDSIDERD